MLVGGSDMPRAEDLPDDLKPLARRQAIRITLERFKADAQGLVNQIKSALAEVEAQRHAETAAERAALAEAERQRHTAEEARVAERVRQESERLRSAQLAGMDPAQVRKAEELANWEFIKAKTDPAEFRDHLARFAEGPTERFAAERLAGLTWAALDRSDKVALRAFIDEFPKAPDVAAAETALAAIEAQAQAAREAAEARTRETEAWGAVAARTDKKAIESFLKAWPSGQHAPAAKVRLQELRSAGRFSRRAMLKGVGYGVGGTAAVGAAYAALVPGMPVWRLLNDQSARTFSGHTETVYAVAIAPDSNTALSGSWDKTLKLWNLATGNALHTFTGHEAGVVAVAIAPDGKTALSGSRDSTVKLWDLATGKELRTFTGHVENVDAVAIAPDGKNALSGGIDTTLKLWDLTR